MSAARKLLSVLLSFALVISSTPVPALGEVMGDEPEAAILGQDEAPEFEDDYDDQEQLPFADEDATTDATDDAADDATDSFLTPQTSGEQEWEVDGVKYTYVTYQADGGGEQAAILSVAVTDATLAESSLDLVIPPTVGEDNIPVVALDCSSQGQSRGFYFWGDGQGGRNKTNRAIRSVTVPASVTTVSKGFFESPDNSTVIIKRIAFQEGSQVDEIPDNCFKGLTQLESVILPEGITAIGEAAFMDCGLLATMTYPGGGQAGATLPGALETIGNQAFQNCGSLTSAMLSEGVVSIGANAFASCSALQSATLPDSLRTIGDQAFLECGALSSVAFGTSMTTAQLEIIGKNAFKGDSLESALIPDSVTAIAEGAFMNQKHEGSNTLTEVRLGSTQEASHLQSIGIDAFRNAAMTEIALPNTLTSLNYNVIDPINRQSPFTGCNQLQNIVWPTAHTENGFTSIGGFWDCPALSNGEIISSIPSWVTTIDDYAFYNCSLTSANIPNGVATIGTGAFEGNKLTEVTIPASATRIYEKAFYCKSSKLSKITFAEQGAPLTMGDHEFYALANDVVVEIPERVTFLGESVFDFCASNSFYLYNKDIKFSGLDADGDSAWGIGHNAYCGTIASPAPVISGECLPLGHGRSHGPLGRLFRA